MNFEENMDQDRFYSSITAFYEHIFPLNPKQVEFVKSEFDSLNGINLLDAGCSIGQLAHALSEHGAKGVGIDLNNDMIKKASNNFKSSAIDFREMNMLHLKKSFPNLLFDAVICFGNTLVHLDSLSEINNFFRQTASILKPEGKLLFQVLNYDYILDERITELPPIDNTHIRFERQYQLPEKEETKVEFNTKLTIKATGESIQNSTLLLPVRKVELEKELATAGFNQIRFYANFAKAPYGGNHLPLVVVASL